MFSALRQGNSLYILEKGDAPKLSIGQVISVSAPQTKFGSFPTDTTVDITVKVNDSTQEFKQIPSTLTIANFGSAVISETKESMSNEVESLLRNSRQVIESVPYHEKAIESFEGILKDLNPQFAKQKAQEEKIDSLETKVGGIQNKLDSIYTMLNKALNKE